MEVHSSAKALEAVICRGHAVACASKQQLIELIEAAVDSARGLCLMAQDAGSFVLTSDIAPELNSFRAGVVSIADGWPVALLASTSAKIRVARSPGPDLFHHFINYSPRRHFIVGGDDRRATVLNSLAQEKGGQICGFFSGMISDPKAFDLTDLANEIASSKSEIAWICLGSVKQFIIASRLREILPNVVIIAVGAAVDFESGRLSRAPRLMRSLGLEWAYRFALEPKRLWRRYLVEAPLMLRWLVMAAASPRQRLITFF